MSLIWIPFLLVCKIFGQHISLVSSDYSALVFQGHIGTPPQSLLLALSFEALSSFLYTPRSCLEFVVCYDDQSSSTYMFDNVVEITGTSALGKVDGYFGKDKLSMSGISGDYREIQFATVKRVANYRTVSNRDVAGVVSLSPISGVMGLHKLVIGTQYENEEQSKPVWNLQVLPSEAPTDDLFTPGLNSYSAGVEGVIKYWSIVSHLCLKKKNQISRTTAFGPVLLAIVPDLPDLVLPIKLMDLFLAKFFEKVGDVYIETDNPTDILGGFGGAIHNDGRLYMPCSISGDVTSGADLSNMKDVSILFEDPSLQSRPKFVEISKDHLVVLGAMAYHFSKVFDAKGNLLCPTRLVFGPPEWPIKLGLPFMNSVEFIVFDFEKRAFTVAWRKWLNEQPMLSPPSAIPTPMQATQIYALPRFTFPVWEETLPGSDQSRVVFRSHSNENRPAHMPSLVMNSRNPILQGSTLIYPFTKVQGDYAHSGFLKDIDGLFSIPMNAVRISSEEYSQQFRTQVAFYFEQYHPFKSAGISVSPAHILPVYAIRINDRKLFLELKLVSAEITYLIQNENVDSSTALCQECASTPVSPAECLARIDNCAICLANFKPDEVVRALRPSCHYLFGDDCDIEWIRPFGICGKRKLRSPPLLQADIEYEDTVLNSRIYGGSIPLHQSTVHEHEI